MGAATGVPPGTAIGSLVKTGEKGSTVSWFVLRPGRFPPLPPDAEGTVRSEGVPGPVAGRTGVARGDMPQVLPVAQQGVTSTEHVAFLRKLEAPSRDSMVTLWTISRQQAQRVRSRIDTPSIRFQTLFPSIQ
jgi:hypothetical protein